MPTVYMDNNATTPLHPEVAEEMVKYMRLYGNPSSHHSLGSEARDKIEEARAICAEFIGASPKEIIFTSGGSEANNLVIKGVGCKAQACCSRGITKPGHIITSAIEHPSVISTCRCLEPIGTNVTYIGVDKDGLVSPAEIEKAITSATSLISIMHANNEIGTIQPIREIAEIAQKHKIPFHTDAVQSLGKVPLNVNEIKANFVSWSAHKLYGPKGLGFLYRRKGARVCPLIDGGHQEYRIRAGTENTLAIIGTGKCIQLAQKEMAAEIKKITKLRDMLWEGIKARIPDAILNGHPEKRLPGCLNVGFKYIEGESILLHLDSEGICASTGSACSSDSLEPSHVLLAMGISAEDAHGSVRFSLGRENTEADVKYVLEKLPPVIELLRRMSPLTPRK